VEERLVQTPRESHDDCASFSHLVVRAELDESNNYQWILLTLSRNLSLLRADDFF
jgi:hypothetical protein